MGYPITIANQTVTLLNPNALGFQHTSFSDFSAGRNGQLQRSAPSVELVTTNPAKLDKCPSTHSSNLSNDCTLIAGMSTLRTQYGQQSSLRASVLNLIDQEKDKDNFSEAIEAAKQLETYFLDMCRVFAEREAYAKYLRQYSYGLQDKKRCCYRNRELDEAQGDAGSLKNQAWQEAREMQATVKEIQNLQAAVNDSSLSDLQVEEQRARTNYQIARTNQEISKEGFVTSQLALSEGSGKLVYVVMALVAAFFVYRFVIRK